MHVPISSIDLIRDQIGDRVARHMERTFRTAITGPNVVSDHRFFSLVSGEPHPFGNLAFVSDPADTEGTTDAIRPLVDSGMPSAVIYVASPSADVASLLAKNGFQDHGPMPAMAVDIERLAPTALPTGYEFVRVLQDQVAREWTTTLAIGYGLPDSLAQLFSPSALGGANPSSDAAVQWFGILKGDKIVSVSMLVSSDGVAGIYCVATIEEERGKGLGAHVTAEPLRLAYDIGYRVGVLQSSEAGFPVYSRLGFEHVGGLGFYLRMPEG